MHRPTPAGDPETAADAADTDVPASATPVDAAVTEASAQGQQDGIPVTPVEAPRRASLSRAAAWVAPASFAANLLGYAFNLVLSRWLGPAGYGELGALLSLGLIGLVPALAVQPVVARLTALADEAELPALARAALLRGALVGVVTASLMVLALPLVGALLRVETAPVLWLALSLLPGPVITAAQGLLQGRERFRPLAAVFVAAAALRLAGGVAGVALVGGVTGALAGTAVGALLAAALAASLTGAFRRDGGHDAVGPPASYGRELAVAAVALLGLLVLGNVDVLLARNRLTPEDAGLYAVGAVVAKAGFWAPQFVQVLVYARLAEGGHGRLLARSVLAVAGAGTALVAACVVLGEPLVVLAFGERYAPLGDVVWVFAAHGSVLALAQLLLYARLAAADRRLSAVVAVLVLLEVTAVVLIDASTPLQVALVALGSAVALAVVAALLHRPAAPVRGVVATAAPTVSPTQGGGAAAG